MVRPLILVNRLRQAFELASTYYSKNHHKVVGPQRPRQHSTGIDPEGVRRDGEYGQNPSHYFKWFSSRTTWIHDHLLWIVDEQA